MAAILKNLVLLDTEAENAIDGFKLRSLLSADDGGMMVKAFPIIKDVKDETQMMEVLTAIRKNLKGLEHAIVDLN
jgi:hypothetical protein